MNSSVEQSPVVPQPVHAVIELFDGALTGVVFPDVDRALLAESVSEVEDRRADLQRALESVRQARESLEASQAQLLERARRAHAYATVFAQGNAELTAELAAIKLGGRALAPKRTRPRKTKTKQTSLSVADSDAA